MKVAGHIAGDRSAENEADPPAPAGGRKKTSARGVKAWLSFNSAGEARRLEAGKQAIMRRTGLPARDLRILDPQLSYPSTILGRERAIVINLEHIKAVVTAHEILILNSMDPIVSPFVHQLQQRLHLRQGHQANTLENEAHPALDKLTSKISTLNLELVRQIKSRLVAITGRVQKVRDEFEHLLDDDEDMAELYLTNKLLQQQQSNASPQSSQMDQTSSSNEERFPAEISSEENDMENHNCLISGSSMIFGYGHESLTFSTRTSCKHPDVEELEMLLEAYFVQIDSTLNKLTTLREYVDDTEDYINIMLDDKQNHLLQMGVVLMTATLIVSTFVVLVAIFGMNIKVELFDENKSGTTKFLWTVGGGAVGSLVLYVVAISWCKNKGLLD